VAQRVQLEQRVQVLLAAQRLAWEQVQLAELVRKELAVQQLAEQERQAHWQAQPLQVSEPGLREPLELEPQAERGAPADAALVQRVGLGMSPMAGVVQAQAEQSAQDAAPGEAATHWQWALQVLLQQELQEPELQEQELQEQVLQEQVLQEQALQVAPDLAAVELALQVLVFAPGMVTAVQFRAGPVPAAVHWAPERPVIALKAAEWPVQQYLRETPVARDRPGLPASG
jgi:hypothetical protein